MPKDSISDQLSTKSRFYIALGHYLQTFSLLEVNIGLCIRLLVNRQDPRVAHPFLHRMSTQRQLEALKDLIFYKHANDNPQTIAGFNKWFKHATQAKAARNSLVHGYWEYTNREEKPIRFTPLSWSYGPDPNVAERPSQDMSLSDFEAIVAKMEGIFDEFMRLRKIHGL